MILKEGSRDNLLKPYVELLNSRGIQCDISQAKRYFLTKFVNEANIRSLSLDSNFYLAGVTRYYLEGKLTVNSELNVFNPDIPDEFDRDLCQRVSALIVILRNAYIDSVGEAFEQPENFGTMKFEALMRKYRKKIDIELGVDTGKEKKEKPDNLDRNNRVGNGYSFDILYSFEDARKYNQYTEPGAWCITYGQQWFNSYAKGNSSTNYQKIHYVIFRKDGYENIPRQKGSNWTSQKPQDEFGNSLIAMLQSNDSWEPNCITSRWNHGASSDRSECEADHAYTTEEFMQITGVNQADLERIYQIWKTDREKRKVNTADRKELNKQRLNVLRIFKYAQIRINGGNYNGAFGDSVITTEKILTGRQRLLGLTDKIDDAIEAGNQEALIASLTKQREKAIMDIVRACSVEIEGEKYYFVMDKKQILFDTILKKDGPWDSVRYRYFTSDCAENSYEDDLAKYKHNVVICDVVNGKMIYDTRKHQFVNIDGVKKFKYIAELTSWQHESIIKNEVPVYYEVKMSGHEMALLDLSTNNPIQLPNGAFWFEELFASGQYNYRWGREIRTHVIGKKDGWLCFIYDSASGEKYFYDLEKRAFFTPELDEGETITDEIFSNDTLGDGLVLLSLKDNSYNETYRRYYKLYKNDEKVTLFNCDKFLNFVTFGNGYAAFTPYINGRTDEDYVFCNYKLGKIIDIPKPEGSEVRYWNSNTNNPTQNKLVSLNVVIRNKNGWGLKLDKDMLFSVRDGCFLKNPYTNNYLFDTYNVDYVYGNVTIYDVEGNGKTVLKLSDNGPILLKPEEYRTNGAVRLNESQFKSLVKKLVKETIIRIKSAK